MCHAFPFLRCDILFRTWLDLPLWQRAIVAAMGLASRHILKNRMSWLLKVWTYCCQWAYDQQRSHSQVVTHAKLFSNLDTVVGTIPWSRTSPIMSLQWTYQVMDGFNSTMCWRISWRCSAAPTDVLHKRMTAILPGIPLNLTMSVSKQIATAYVGCLHV